MLQLKRQVVTTLVFGASLAILAPDKAEACSQLELPPVRLFGADAQVPANLIYFQVLAEDPGPLELTLGDGTVVAASIRTIGSDRVFAPDGPVPAAELGSAELTKMTLTYTHLGATRSYEFSAYERTDEISLRAPELVIEETGILNPEFVEQRVMYQRLHYYDSDAWGNLYHLIDSVASVDGVPAWYDAQSRRIEVATQCSDPTGSLLDSCGYTRGVPEGEHTVKVSTHIVGFDEQPPDIEKVVVTDCNLLAVPASTTSVTSTSNAAPIEEAIDPASTEDAIDAMDPTTESFQGCAFSGSRSAVGGRSWWVALLALALGVGRVRRRKEAAELRSVP